ncbi:hypothetical protein HK102_001315, partial [Quaeritorhiza haematococci]
MSSAHANPANSDTNSSLYIKSAFELERDKNIAERKSLLATLGLGFTDATPSFSDFTPSESNPFAASAAEGRTGFGKQVGKKKRRFGNARTKHLYGENEKTLRSSKRLRKEEPEQ